MTAVAGPVASAIDDEEVSARDVLAEQVRLVRQMAGGSAWTMLFLSVFVAAVLHDAGPRILIWLALQVGLKLEAYVELKWFFSDADIAARPEHMARRLMLGQAPHAACWSSLVWFAAPHASAAEITFVVMVLGGALSGGVTTYGALPRVHLAYITAFISVQILTYLSLRQAIVGAPYLAFPAFLTIIFCIGIYMNTRVAGRTYRAFILLGFANARLARRLEQEVLSTRAAQREAEAANAAKSTFLASASHDLRQPIHALGLFLALLDRSKLNRKQKETVTLARSALKASFEMLDALLDFSRAEAGVIVPRLQPFRIGEVLRRIEEEVALTADEKRLFYRTRDSDALVESDPALVAIILQNLVTNAIRYTATGGVLVGCRRRGERIVVEVWDSGVGIPSEQWEAVFSDFIQLGNPERDRRKGLGLGLAIARRLARLVGSEITLRSTVGRGSVFRFSLPVSEIPFVAAGLPSPPDPCRDVDVRDAARVGHVLIIDDDEAIRVSLSDLLKETGYSVEAVETIGEARDSAKARAPDVLICDSRLRAGERGAEAARAIRAELGRRVPALLITGDTHPDRIAEAAREDIEILYKPTQPDLLLAAVKRLIAAG